MPSLEMHCQECVEKLGEPFTHVHEWLDALWPVLKTAHRAVRHNDQGVEYVRKTWGEKAAEAARLHIAQDEDFEYRDGLWIRKPKQQTKKENHEPKSKSIYERSKPNPG